MVYAGAALTFWRSEGGFAADANLDGLGEAVPEGRLFSAFLA
jgi:hypothetical protein